ncbi:sulfoxide reductase catalytic subunit YedY [Devosia enhydra]|uniref:Sulfoxide reductase catalytic subunit YedY n=1 Tax=Devosia enhydra TaxID=665118 RepID=A0A1K2HW71_9HYPH|nr:molybdopterin-dependent oxidoreductase [Devosia enhydra]SFZ83202.1 sulfoxide reductase catalytic subunit YedY [Devosia enhydra]
MSDTPKSGLNLTRRRLIGLGGATAASLVLSGCDQFDFLGQRDHPVRDVLERANDLTYRVQRMLLGQNALAREYSPSEIRQGQRPNGSVDPTADDYLALKAGDFANYRLSITGLVERPQAYSLAELRNMPAQSQITRHDCVEGWSCIAKWTGTRLAPVLDAAGVRPEARFVVFHCYDRMPAGLAQPQPYYESCDLVDARHPQTILAYGLNDQVLPVSNGAPLRVRIERALGYKQPKYVHTIELVESFAAIQGGKGGYWEDNGYDWYGGI